MDDDPVARLKTPEACEQFAINVEERGKPELALAARRRGVELRAAAHGAKTNAEREALEAVYAYERSQSMMRRRRFREPDVAHDRPPRAAVEHVVTRNVESMGYAALVTAGMQDKAFEVATRAHGVNTDVLQPRTRIDPSEGTSKLSKRFEAGRGFEPAPC